jgi:predicted ATP-grasp superfamily ATP-dependent carboligase
MRILVYEFVTGGGWYSTGDDAPPESLLSEGRAMRDALASDFAAIDGVQVNVLADERFDPPAFKPALTHRVRSAAQEQALLADLCSRADWTVIIAPEFDGHLLSRVQLVEQSRGRLLGPTSNIVALAADKQLTAEHLAKHGVPTPRGIGVQANQPLPRDFRYPAVLKPRDGAGSRGIHWAESPGATPTGSPAGWRLETFYPGVPASVAILGGPRGIAAFPPCRQYLSDDSRFVYYGGSLPLDAPLAERAARLAIQAAQTLTTPVGYLGMDLVLGADPRGADDVVIEINPRLTTSYVGLRALARGNLAEAMLAVAVGEKVELSWHAGPIQFEPTGRINSTIGVT